MPRPIAQLGERDVGHIVLKPAGGRIEIEYGVASLGAGEIARYQVRPEGVDLDWLEPSTARSMVYPNLAPGCVSIPRASRARGLAHQPQPVTVAFTVLPPLWRHGWFVALVLLGVGLAAAVGPPPSPLTALAYANLQPEVLGGPGAALGYLLYQAAHLGWLISVNLWWFCLLKLMLRHTTLAASGKVALDTCLIAPVTNPWIVGAAYAAIGFGTSLWLIVHHGIVAVFVAACVRATLLNFPLTLSVTDWFSPLSGLAFLVVGALLFAGARLTMRREELG